MQIARLLAVLLLIIGFCGRARADETPPPDAVQAATELMAIISPDMMKQLVSQMTATIWPRVEQNARARNIDDATIAEMRKEFERIEIDFLNDSMKSAPAVYAKHFTIAELHDMAAFYRTPTGAKALRELPMVTTEFTAQMLPRLQGVDAQMNEAFGRILRAHGYVK